jgi:AcrR family transcriptional regulator
LATGAQAGAVLDDARLGGLMARTKATVVLDRVIAGVVDIHLAGDEQPADDDVTVRILDATAELLAAYGLRRWSIDDVAERSGVGRTTVYRTFDGRDALVHAVLARELIQTLAAIEAGVNAYESVEDRLVEGGLIALAALRGSLVERLLHSDPATFLPFLTTGAGPLVAMARAAMTAGLRVAAPDMDPHHAAELAEITSRLGLSFILTRDTVFPIDDDAAARESLRRLLRPLLATGG